MPNLDRTVTMTLKLFISLDPGYSICWWNWYFWQRLVIQSSSRLPDFNIISTITHWQISTGPVPQIFNPPTSFAFRKWVSRIVRNLERTTCAFQTSMRCICSAMRRRKGWSPIRVSMKKLRGFMLCVRWGVILVLEKEGFLYFWKLFLNSFVIDAFQNMRVLSFSFKFSPRGEGKNLANVLLHHAFPKRHHLLFAYDFR